MPSARQEFGLVAPRAPGNHAWWLDAHWLIAAAMALPVWAVVAAWPGLHARAPSGWAAWASFALLQPLAEELAFRGVLQGTLLQTSLARRIGPLSQANLLVTACFSAAHLASQSAGWALAVALPSLVFGHLRERLGSVLPPMLMHTLYNVGFGLAAAWSLGR